MPRPDLSKQPSLAEGYERYAEPLTVGIAEQALAKIGPLGSGARVIDIGAGTGAFSMIAAAAGAEVLAIDYSPEMVERLNQRLVPFSTCEARHMDGQALTIENDVFDIAASFFGIITFPDWRRGLHEMVRVTRPGGQIALATWPSVNGAGAAEIAVEAFREINSDQGTGKSSAAPLGSEASLRSELEAAGCEDVRVWTVEQVWGGQPLDSMLAELECALELTPFYRQLDDHMKHRMREPMRTRLASHVEADGIVRMPVKANIAVATVLAS